MPSARLADRAVVSVSGPEARSFLERLVTCGIEGMPEGSARFGALLTPQGKIAADFILFASRDEAGDVFLLDCHRDCAADLVKRLGLYKLRAKLAILDRSGELEIAAGWDGAAVPASAVLAAPDPRLPDLGWRAVLCRADQPTGIADEAGEGAYHARRIALGIPEIGRDLPFGEPFPHEALMDQLGGVDFAKGCYVGQEVVSRMQHRGTARTRIVPLAFEAGASAPTGAPVTAGERALGRTGEAADGHGLAAIRLDRAAEALSAGEEITAGGLPVRLVKPAWIRFAFPGEPAP